MNLGEKYCIYGTIIYLIMCIADSIFKTYNNRISFGILYIIMGIALCLDKNINKKIINIYGDTE